MSTGRLLWGHTENKNENSNVDISGVYLLPPLSGSWSRPKETFLAPPPLSADVENTVPMAEDCYSPLLQASDSQQWYWNDYFKVDELNGSHGDRWVGGMWRDTQDWTERLLDGATKVFPHPPRRWGKPRRAAFCQSKLETDQGGEVKRLRGWVWGVGLGGDG